MEETQKRKSGGWKRVVLIVLCVILSLVLMGLVAGAIYADSILKSINRTDPSQTSKFSQEEADQWERDQLKNEDPTVDPSTPTMDENDVIWDDNPADTIGGENLVNVLLIGQDRRPGEKRARSDSMILCTFNKSEKTLTMTSFMRDMYVQIPGYKDNRINTSYAFGGMELLDQTIKENFGVEIDANVEVDFSEFTQIIDLLGGVEIELTQREVNYLINKGHSASAGKCRLNGAAALEYSRIRYLDSDFVRTNRQRNVLTSLLSAYKDQSLTKMLSLLDDILPLITTDMTNQQIIGYVKDIFPLIADAQIVTQRIPADGTYTMTMIRGMSVLVPQLQPNRDLLKETLLGEEAE